MSWFELAVVAFIMIGIFVAWRSGQANPEGTGSLGRKVSKVEGAVTTLDTRLRHVEQDVEELKREAATTKDIERLEQLGERTFRAVDRIEKIILEKGLGR